MGWERDRDASSELERGSSVRLAYDTPIRLSGVDLYCRGDATVQFSISLTLDDAKNTARTGSGQSVEIDPVKCSAGVAEVSAAMLESREDVESVESIDSVTSVTMSAVSSDQDSAWVGVVSGQDAE